MKQFFILGLLGLVTLGAGCENGEVVTTDPVKTLVSSSISIILPADIDLYRTQMTEYSQKGGSNPIITTNFIKQEFTIPYTSDTTKASVEAAAKAIYQSGGGPAQITVDYLKIVSSTAYVVLNIDTSGWAGVSVAQAIVHPIVSKTLQEIKGIQTIVFGQVPQN